MGRELKRVALDFKWPHGKVWKGYINPHYRKCPDPTCENGYSPAGRWLDVLSRLLVLPADDVRDEARGRPLHPWLSSVPGAPETRPGQEYADLVKGLSGKEPGFLGYGCESYTVYRKLREAAGLPESWGTCKTCGGDADDPATREAANAWKEEEPPKGEGYQLWETTSEGSPVSPVFDTLDKLCEWCEKNASTFGSQRASAASWKQMLSPDGMVCHREGNMIFL